MEVGKQIKKFRQDLKLSQEELANKIFVTRQTISNWENGKNYPDVNSLVMLRQLFNTSLDILIKGDVIEMKKQVAQDDVRRFKRDTVIFTVLIVLTVVSAVPLFLYLELAGIVLWLLIAGVMIYYAMRLNKQKRNNDIQTYREILASVDRGQHGQEHPDCAPAALLSLRVRPVRVGRVPCRDAI